MQSIKDFKFHVLECYENTLNSRHAKFYSFTDKDVRIPRILLLMLNNQGILNSINK